MKLLVLNANTGDVINEFGNGTILSNPELGPITLQAVPNVQNGESVGSVTFTINGQTTTVTGPDFVLTPSGEGSVAYEPALLPEGNYTINAVAYATNDGQGPQLDARTATISTLGAPATEAAGSGEGIERSEFNTEAEAEAEAEVEVESEAEDDIAGGAVAAAASASVFGSNAVASTLTSGSVSLDLANANEQIVQAPTTSAGPTGASTQPVGGDGLFSGGEPDVKVEIVSAEAEAEVEIEAEAETEAEIGSASATAGLSGAAAAVGTNTYLAADGSARLAASETATSLTGSTGTSTSVSDVSGAVNPPQSAPLATDEGTPNAPTAGVRADTNTGPNSETLQEDLSAEDAVQTDAEAEVEVESEVEASAEAEAGAAAAAVSAASGVAVAGDFATVDTATSIGTAAVSSAVTQATPDIFTGFNTSFTDIVAPEDVPVSEATVVNFSNGAASAAQPGTPVNTTTRAPDVEDVAFGTGLFEAEAEAEAEVEVEVENGAAAVATGATGGGGSNAYGASVLVSASTAGVAATDGAARGLTRANDVVEKSTFRSENDAALTAAIAQGRVAEDGNLDTPVAEAEAEADVEAEVNLDTATIELTSDGGAIGNASAASGVALGGILTARTGEISTGVTRVAERPSSTDDATSTREALPAAAGDLTVAAPSNFEVEVEAEAEAEAEAEVGFNSAGAGAGAVAVAAMNSFIGQTADAATATSTSVSVKENGEKVYDDADRPGPNPLDNAGGFAPQSVDLNAVILEVETEAEAEAEVGYNAGAAAGAAGAAGFEGISAVLEMDATTNAAASAAAAGAYTSVTITVPDEGMAGFVTASARAWDPLGRGVAAAVAVAGLADVAGFDNESEAEAEGLYEVFVEVSIYTEAYDPADVSYLFDVAAQIESANSDADEEPEGRDSRLESETEVEAEAEAEAGYGVAAAAAGAAVSGFGATVVSDTKTATGEFDIDAVFAGTVEGNGADNDITGTDKIDVLRGLGGDDVLSGGALGDRLEGGDGDDTLDGGDGGDSLFGGRGQDMLMGGAGSDFLAGGEGEDTASYANATASVQASLLTRDESAGDAEGDLFVGVENLEGSDFDDVLSGDLKANAIFGLDGDDVLYGDGFAPVAALEESNTVYRLYETAFDRRPDDGGYNTWASRVLEGDQSVEEIANTLANSREFTLRFGALDDDAFVQRLYQNALNRDADDGGLAAWTGALEDGASRGEVIAGFADSDELRARTDVEATEFATEKSAQTWTDDIFRLYEAALGRTPDEAGLRAWIDELTGDASLADVAAGFIESDEFTARFGSLTDQAFIEQLYQNVLDRDPSDAEVNGWLDEIAAGAERANVLIGFSQSAEFRADTDDDVEAWVRGEGTNDVLEGGEGDDQLIGGSFSDVFVFSAEDAGMDTVRDFETWDTMQFEGFGYDSADDVRAQLTQDGTNVMFEDGDVSVLVLNAQLGSLSDEMLGF